MRMNGEDGLVAQALQGDTGRVAADMQFCSYLNRLGTAPVDREIGLDVTDAIEFQTSHARPREDGLRTFFKASESDGAFGVWKLGFEGFAHGGENVVTSGIAARANFLPEAGRAEYLAGCGALVRLGRHANLLLRRLPYRDFNRVSRTAD